MMDKPITGISLVGMNRADIIRSYIDQVGPEARFELAYTTSPEFLEEIAPLIDGRVISVHACCPATEFFPNFGSADPEIARISFEDMENTLQTALRFGASTVVLHAGYVTDLAMPASFSRRKAILDREEFQKDIRHPSGAICGPEYSSQPHYRRHADRAKANLVILARRYAKAGVTLAVENLNPRVGYLFQTPDEMVELAELDPALSLCLDIGHLHISAQAFGFDYLEGIQRIAATGKVVTTHLHSNTSTSDHFEDDHANFYDNGFPVREIVRLLKECGAALVLETLNDPVGNTAFLARCLASQQALVR
ncbi:MAG: sugar phosphate isomerase/epimerase [Rectinema sp.]|nr:sugar phosphate isomerase/epimerase [Rectinema sp.]